MSSPYVRLSKIIKVHYGKALKKDERDEKGEWDVFGSSGRVGKHNETLTDTPTIIIGRAYPRSSQRPRKGPIIPIPTIAIDGPRLSRPRGSSKASLRGITKFPIAEKVTAAELLEFTRDKLADYKRPRDIRFIESMPINPTGKVDKRSLKAKYLAGKESDADDS